MGFVFLFPDEAVSLLLQNGLLAYQQWMLLGHNSRPKSRFVK